MTGDKNGGDPVRLFRAALPPRAYDALDMTPQVIIDIHTCITHGWTPEKLAGHVSYHVIGLHNADQTMRARLHRAAQPETTQ
jgi:hypothetical protein